MGLNRSLFMFAFHTHVALLLIAPAHASLKEQAQLFAQAVTARDSQTFQASQEIAFKGILRRTSGFPCLGSSGFVPNIEREFQCFLYTLQTVASMQTIYLTPSERSQFLESGLQKWQGALSDPWVFSHQSIETAVAIFRSRFKLDISLLYSHHSVGVLAQSLVLANSVGAAEVADALLRPQIATDLARALLLKASRDQATGAFYWKDTKANPSVLLTALALGALVSGSNHFWSPQQAVPAVQWILQRQAANGSWPLEHFEGAIGEKMLATAQILEALMAYESLRQRAGASTLLSVRAAIDKAMGFILSHLGANASLSGPVWDALRATDPMTRLELESLKALPQRYLRWICEGVLVSTD